MPISRKRPHRVIVLAALASLAGCAGGARLTAAPAALAAPGSTGDASLRRSDLAVPNIGHAFMSGAGSDGAFTLSKSNTVNQYAYPGGGPPVRMLDLPGGRHAYRTAGIALYPPEIP